MANLSKSVLIIGVSSALGTTLAKCYRDSGYTVSGTYFSHKPTLPEIVLIRFDIESPADIKKLPSADIIIVCVGYGLSRNVTDYTDTEIDRLFKLNVFGPVKVIKQLLPRLQVNSKVLFVGSLNSLLPLPGFGFYTAAKAALLHTVLALRYEVTRVQIGIVLSGAFTSNQNHDSQLAHTPLRERSLVLKKVLPISQAESVAKLIFASTQKPILPPVTLVGRDTFLTSAFVRLAPWGLFDWIYTQVWTKK